MNWIPWIALLFFSEMFVIGQCQSYNFPPIINVNRYWRILDNEPIGSRITQADGGDAEGGNSTYGLELIQFSEIPPAPLPFAIDPNTGVVHLNESLKGKAGKNIAFYVTLSDGELVAKVECNALILDSSSTHKPSHNRRSIARGNPINPGVTTAKDLEKEENENELNLADYQVKIFELDGIIVSILSVCAVFITVGVIAIVFRKKLVFEKSKDTKDDTGAIQWAKNLMKQTCTISKRNDNLDLQY